MPRKRVVRLTDRHNMTIAVYGECKTTTSKSVLCEKVHYREN